MEQADAQIITLALRRANEGGPANILDYIPGHVTLLPNTSGARNADEAVRIARLARAAGCGDFVKIEVIRDAKYLLPDNTETVKATEILAKEGFVVMPYMYPDLNAARDLANAGAACIKMCIRDRQYPVQRYLRPMPHWPLPWQQPSFIPPSRHLSVPGTLRPLSFSASLCAW